MNEPAPDPLDRSLSERLRSARPTPPLPPRFAEQVWRRIEAADRPASAPTWLESLAALLLRPRLALATVAVLMLAGALLGAQSGTQFSRQDAQLRYLTAVAPNILH